jgi:hypothetical protein
MQPDFGKRYAPASDADAGRYELLKFFGLFLVW